MSNYLTLKPEQVEILTGVWELEKLANQQGRQPGEDSLAVMEADHVPGLQDLCNAGLLRARANHLNLDRKKYGIPARMPLSKYAYCLTPEGRSAAIMLEANTRARV